MRIHLSLVALLFSAVVTAFAAPALADPLTRVTINGAVTPVYFNDGDSFRIQAGPFKGAQARLSGYNTLETFGPVHTWGTWTAKELYAISKLATLTARRGTWSCEGDGKKDGYGRLLLFCRDLAHDLISKGLAHNYSVDDTPGDAELQEAQRQAMRARIGMWAHGVPRFIMTSLHSKAEGGDKNGKTSNRLISTTDARSEKWEHDEDYAECQKVCHRVPSLTPVDVEAAVALAQADEGARAAIAALALTDAELRSAIATISEMVLAGSDLVPELGIAPRAAAIVESAKHTTTLIKAIKNLHVAGKLAVSGTREDSCQVFVDFRRRFGGDRAVCLR